jgi:hypothetical protein
VPRAVATLRGIALVWGTKRKQGKHAKLVKPCFEAAAVDACISLLVDVLLNVSRSSCGQKLGSVGCPCVARGGYDGLHYLTTTPLTGRDPRGIRRLHRDAVTELTHLPTLASPVIKVLRGRWRIIAFGIFKRVNYLRFAQPREPNDLSGFANPHPIFVLRRLHAVCARKEETYRRASGLPCVVERDSAWMRSVNEVRDRYLSR